MARWNQSVHCMPDLNLKDANAKLKRAMAFHRDLDQSAADVVKAANPYTFRFGNIDPVSGMTTLYARGSDLQPNTLGLIIADYVTNLRASLDYLISALAKSQNVEPSSKHQFPIFISEQDYDRKNGAASEVGKGDLSGLSWPLDIIRRLQPFHRHPEKPTDDPLWALYHLCNSAKHREIAVASAGLDAAHMKFEGGDVTEIVPLPGTFTPSGQEFEVARLRFSEPYPTEVNVRTQISLAVFSWHLKQSGAGVAVRMIDVLRLYDETRHVVDEVSAAARTIHAP